MIKKILKENFIYVFLIVLTIIIFILLYRSSVFDKIVTFDNKVINYFNNNRLNYFTYIMRYITNFGDYHIPIIIIVCMLLCFKNKIYFYIIASSYTFAGIISFVAKGLVLRPRPLEAVISIPSSYSFPSGHTLTSIVLYTTLCYMCTLYKTKKEKIICFTLVNILIFLIGFSRVYLGVHFFSDVIGGLILGVLCEMLIINIISKNFKNKLLYGKNNKKC